MFAVGEKLQTFASF